MKKMVLLILIGVLIILPGWHYEQTYSDDSVERFYQECVKDSFFDLIEDENLENAYAATFEVGGEARGYILANYNLVDEKLAYSDSDEYYWRKVAEEITK